MKKAILISIKPEYVEKILNRWKILEIRKSIPKCDLPCKVYIYCSKGQELWGDGTGNTWYGIAEDEDIERVFELNPTLARLNGKVVAEFTLNEIDKIEICDPYIFRNNGQEDWKYFKKNACLTCEQMMEYIGYGKDYDGWDKKYDTGYAWHIDNLIIYENPLELSEFEKYGSYETVTDCYKKQNGLCNKGYGMKGNYIGCEKARVKRPPQSYMYVEELSQNLQNHYNFTSFE